MESKYDFDGIGTVTYNHKRHVCNMSKAEIFKQSKQAIVSPGSKPLIDHRDTTVATAAAFEAGDMT